MFDWITFDMKPRLNLINLRLELIKENGIDKRKQTHETTLSIKKKEERFKKKRQRPRKKKVTHTLGHESDEEKTITVKKNAFDLENTKITITNKIKFSINMNQF